MYFFCQPGFISETIAPALSPTRTEVKREENLVTLSDTRSTGPSQGLGQSSKHSVVWDIVKRLNDERIKVDQELRDEEQAEIRSLLNKQVKRFYCIF
jgi:hypothetical protein